MEAQERYRLQLAGDLLPLMTVRRRGVSQTGLSSELCPTEVRSATEQTTNPNPGDAR